MTDKGISPVNIKLARGTNVANYAGAAGEIVHSSPYGQLYFFTSPDTYSVINAVGSPFSASHMQGTSHGYVSGGSRVGPSPNPAAVDVAEIEKYAFATSTTGVNVGTIDDGTFPKQKLSGAGTSSSTHGYHAGGYETSYNNPGFPFPPGRKVLYRVDKFPFSSDTGATVGVLDLAVNAYGMTGMMSTTHGYYSGGFRITNPGNTPAGLINNHQKMSFSSDADATSTGTLATSRVYATGHASGTHGYIAGGKNFEPSTVDPSFPGSAPYAPGIIASIEKMSTSSDVNSTSVATLVEKVTNAVGLSSFTNGYTAGGSTPTTVHTIQKFPFSSDTNSTDVAEIPLQLMSAQGGNSDVHGYIVGGIGASYYDTIQRFPFSSDSPSVDLSHELTESFTYAGGHQV